LKATLPRASVVGVEAPAYFTVELACPTDGWGRLPQLSAQARTASEQMRREGLPVRFLRSIFVPEADACFHLYAAASAEHVREAARRAALPFERVVEAISEPGSSNLPRR
jgi:hypothetical protein